MKEAQQTKTETTVAQTERVSVGLAHSFVSGYTDVPVHLPIDSDLRRRAEYRNEGHVQRRSLLSRSLGALSLVSLSLG